MPRKSHRQVVLLDARPVVYDSDLLDAALSERHADFGCSGIQAILKQLLQYGCGSFHDFTCCDLADQRFRQWSDGGHDFWLRRGSTRWCVRFTAKK